MVAHVLFDFLIFFLVLGLVEAVVKPIAYVYTKWKIVKVAPYILDQLDFIMPEMIREKTGAEIEEFLRNFLSEKTGEDWKQNEIDFFFTRFYDVRAAADKNKPS